ncbi:hypothetical protein AGR4C_pc30080 [Agrobacterium tumefaciens str. Kerr 14]|uniref:Uncharacterized protein n=1 Tax=Agrobacterium tumefaciens str. Kerr 14 TaxID=1183424 RepID=A0A1S7SHK5_AGRTU|nr:hypothetical protein AGR4C_pc30080 [Agrobacterium tumefaciens str. Kerr 14]
MHSDGLMARIETGLGFFHNSRGGRSEVRTPKTPFSVSLSIVKTAGIFQFLKAFQIDSCGINDTA